MVVESNRGTLVKAVDKSTFLASPYTPNFLGNCSRKIGIRACSLSHVLVVCLSYPSIILAVCARIAGVKGLTTVSIKPFSRETLGSTKAPVKVCIPSRNDLEVMLLLIMTIRLALSSSNSSVFISVSLEYSFSNENKSAAIESGVAIGSKR